jgi:hypothetical protein
MVGEYLKKDDFDGLRHEYRRGDLGEGIRGKYYEKFEAGSNLVLLSPDVAEKFAHEESVNEALRELIKIAPKTVRNKVHPE